MGAAFHGAWEQLVTSAHFLVAIGLLAIGLLGIGLVASSAAFAQAPPATARRSKPSVAAEAAPGPAAPKTDFDVEALTGPPTEKELSRSLEARARYLRVGDERAADTELELLEETRLALGARNVVLASALLIRESQQALLGGRTERAIELAEAAARLSPDLVAAHWNRARVYSSLGTVRWNDTTQAIADMLGAKFTRFRNVVSTLSQLLFMVGLGFLATVIVWSFVQLFKYLRYPAHDLSTKLPAFAGPGEVAIALLLLVALPGMLGFGLATVIVLVLLLVMGYQNAHERRVSIGVLALVGAAPGLIYLASPFVTFPGSRADYMEMAVTEAFAEEAEKALVERTQAGTDVGGALILAMRSRIRGDLEGSVLYYQKALAIDRDDAGARNNLGIAYYLLGREEAAVESFRQSAATRTLAQPFLNQATILADGSHFDEANKLLEDARQIDESLTAGYTRMDASVPTKSKMLDAPLGQGILWARLIDFDADAASDVMGQAWQRVGGRTPALFMPFIALFAGLLGARITTRSRRMSVPCPKCGAPARRDSPAGHCADCEAVFLAVTPVDLRLRQARERVVLRHQRRRRLAERVLSLFAGAGHVLGERAIGGVILVFLFALCLSFALLQGLLPTDAWDVWVDGSEVRVVTTISSGLAGLLVLVSLRQVWR